LKNKAAKLQHLLETAKKIKTTNGNCNKGKNENILLQIFFTEKTIFAIYSL